MMSKKLENYKRYIFIGIIIIALGIAFTTTLTDSMSKLGTVFIAVGGLFFIIGISKKRNAEKS